MQIAFTNAAKRMGELVAGIVSISECCKTCGDCISGYCRRFDSDVPAESLHLKGCEHWFFDDIPF